MVSDENLKFDQDLGRINPTWTDSLPLSVRCVDFAYNNRLLLRQRISKHFLAMDADNASDSGDHSSVGSVM